MIDYSSTTQHAVVGTPLAEVFSVKIDTNGKNCELYGTIEVADDLGSFYIYDFGEDEPETIDQSGSLSLSNSNRSISASSGRFTVTLALRDANGDAGFINGSFAWENVEKDDVWLYDKYLVEKVVGKCGSATVYYTVHSVAVEAIILAKLLRKDEDSASNNKDDTLDVYGSLVAHYGNSSDCDANEDQKRKYQIVVSEETSEVPVEMKYNCLFPLARPIVSVPSYSSFSIEAKLSCCLPNDVKELVWNEKVEFQASSLLGCARTKILKGKYADIMLSVIWVHYCIKLERVEAIRRETFRYGIF